MCDKYGLLPILRVPENIVLREMCGAEREEVMGRWEKYIRSFFRCYEITFVIRHIIPTILWNPNFITPFTTARPFPSQMNSANVLLSFKIHLDIIVPLTSRRSLTSFSLRVPLQTKYRTALKSGTLWCGRTCSMHERKEPFLRFVYVQWRGKETISIY